MTAAISPASDFCYTDASRILFWWSLNALACLAEQLVCPHQMSGLVWSSPLLTLCEHTCSHMLTADGLHSPAEVPGCHRRVPAQTAGRQLAYHHARQARAVLTDQEGVTCITLGPPQCVSSPVVNSPFFFCLQHPSLFFYRSPSLSLPGLLAADCKASPTVIASLLTRSRRLWCLIEDKTDHTECSLFWFLEDFSSTEEKWDVSQSSCSKLVLRNSFIKPCSIHL